MHFYLSELLGKPLPDDEPTGRYAFVTESGRRLPVEPEDDEENVQRGNEWWGWLKMAERPLIEVQDFVLEVDLEEPGRFYTCSVLPFEV
jgi:hypothetical protein